MRRSALSALVVCFFAALLLLANPKPPLSVGVSNRKKRRGRQAKGDG